jgi:O-antigen/teichoic acid export membrane protein
MPGDLTSRAGAAMGWRAIQLAGIEVIYFVRLLILAALLAPEAFGLLAIAMAAIGVMMRLSDVGMIPALVQRADATVLEYDAAWSVGVLRALFVAGVLALTAPFIARAFGEPEATAIIRVLALRPVLEAACSIGIARLTRSLQFRELALLRLPGAVVDLVVAVAAAPSFGVWALVAGALAGAATTTLLSYFFAPHRPRFVLKYEAIQPLIRFGRWVMGTGIVALVGTTALQLVISRLHGAGALGLYFLASKVAFLPVDAASKIVGSVAFPMFSRLKADAPRAAGMFRQLFASQAIVLLPTYAIIFVVAPSLESALGERWMGTSPVIRVLAVACVTGLLGELLAPFFMGKGRPDRAFLLDALQTVVIVALIWPFVAALGPTGGALAWLAGNVTAMLLGLAWLPAVLDGEPWFELPWIVVATVAGLIGMLTAGSVDGAVGGPGGIVAGAAAGLSAAAAVVLLAERRFGLGLADFARSLGVLRNRSA